MTMCPAVQQRRIDKQKLLDFLTANTKMPIEQALATYSSLTGFRIQKLKEYARELKDAKLIEAGIDG